MSRVYSVRLSSTTTAAPARYQDVQTRQHPRCHRYVEQQRPACVQARVRTHRCLHCREQTGWTSAHNHDGRCIAVARRQVLPHRRRKASQPLQPLCQVLRPIALPAHLPFSMPVAAAAIGCSALLCVPPQRLSGGVTVAVERPQQLGPRQPVRAGGMEAGDVLLQKRPPLNQRARARCRLARRMADEWAHQGSVGRGGERRMYCRSGRRFNSLQARRWQQHQSHSTQQRRAREAAVPPHPVDPSCTAFHCPGRQIARLQSIRQSRRPHPLRKYSSMRASTVPRRGYDYTRAIPGLRMICQ